MASVTLTYANGQKETVPLVGNVRVEVDADTPFSRAMNDAGLVKVELSDKEPDTAGHAAGAAVYVEPEAEEEAEEEAPKRRSSSAKAGAKK